MSRFAELAERIAEGDPLRHHEALGILRSDNAELMELVAAGGMLRRKHFGNRVKLNYLVNLKSGLCQEDCSYCSQALGSNAPILKYSWLSEEEAVKQAHAGIEGGAARVCLVASGRGPMHRDVERVAGITAALKREYPDVEVCACLGLLRQGQAERLAESGVDAYNHNINTAESHHDNIVSTHSYADRVATITRVKEAGVSPCSGLIVGMGESPEQIVEAVFALRDLESDSIPINFLVPFDGTPLAGRWELTPAQCLRIVALARFACPEREIRLAGGRELHLRSLQGLALHLANSVFLGDYLTAEGQAAAADLELIRDNGFVAAEPGSLPSLTAQRSTQATSRPTVQKVTPRKVGARNLGATHQSPRPRQRGAGTELEANA